MKRLISIASVLLFILCTPAWVSAFDTQSEIEKNLKDVSESEGLGDGTSSAPVDRKLEELDKDIEGKSGKKEGGGLFSKAKDVALGAAASIDWTDMSWDKVSEIPFNDKAKLVAWAGTQVDSWKDKLGQAALNKGKKSLASLGDSGWQGSLKSVVSALDGVRKSNPETWEKATGALVSAWDSFESEAAEYLTGK